MAFWGSSWLPPVWLTSWPLPCLATWPRAAGSTIGPVWLHNKPPERHSSHFIINTPSGSCLGSTDGSPLELFTQLQSGRAGVVSKASSATCWSQGYRQTPTAETTGSGSWALSLSPCALPTRALAWWLEGTPTSLMEVQGSKCTCLKRDTARMKMHHQLALVSEVIQVISTSFCSSESNR